MIIKIDLAKNTVYPEDQYTRREVSKLFTREKIFTRDLSEIKIIETDFLRRFYVSIPRPLERISIVLVEEPNQVFRKIGEDEEYEIYSMNRETIIVGRKLVCYGENSVGPYIVSEKILSRIYAIDNELVLEADPGSMNYSRDALCEARFIVLPREAPTQLLDRDIVSSMLSRLSKGYYEDGLIWALVRSGFVPRSELPDYIIDGQAYYWPRGDLLRRYLYMWYFDEIPEALGLYREILQQLIDQLSESGGLRIPYITAARMRDIYGSPQQLYVFETLARAYDLFRVEELRDKALRALECYTKQPPECLGFYETRRGGWWFRWGSYHYLSRDPEKKEDLYVLNTHLMGVVGLLEGYRYLDCENCLRHAMRGIEALEELLEEFARSDGYLFYSLYNKERFGDLEDVIMPHTIGYHLLSTRLLLRAAYLLDEEAIRKKFMSYGVRGCEYGYRRYLSGRRDLWRELVRCFVELYRLTGDEEYIRRIDRVTREVNEDIRATGLFIDETRHRFLPPLIRSSEEYSILLLDNDHDEASYYVYSKNQIMLQVSSKKLLGRSISEIRDLRIKSLADLDVDRSVDIAQSGDKYILSLKGSIILTLRF